MCDGGRCRLNRTVRFRWIRSLSLSRSHTNRRKSNRINKTNSKSLMRSVYSVLYIYIYMRPCAVRNIIRVCAVISKWQWAGVVCVCLHEFKCKCVRETFQRWIAFNSLADEWKPLCCRVITNIIQFGSNCEIDYYTIDHDAANAIDGCNCQVLLSFWQLLCGWVGLFQWVWETKTANMGGRSKL